MVQLSRPEVILTHESDLDGFVAGLLLQRLAGKLFDVTVPLAAYHYNQWRQRPLTENSAWVADFNFEARLDKMNWLVVDHHHTEVPARKASLIHDPAKSAGLLSYELCRAHGITNATLDRVVHLNNVADLFLEDDPDFIIANDYANLIKTYQFWNLHLLLGGELENLLDHPLLEVMAVKREVEDPLGLALSKTNIVKITPTVGLVSPPIGNTNLIVHHLLESHERPYPVLMTLLRRANAGMVVSLRSRNGEALKIAGYLQGGGHPNAAGATLPRSVQNTQDAVEYLRKVLGTPEAPEGLNSMEKLFESLTPRV